MAANFSRHWTPPKMGSFVVNCAARTGHGIAGISAIVRDCNGDVIAATVARKRYERKLDAQLQSILAAFKLIHMLTKEKRIIKRSQDITIQTHHKRALQIINGDASDGIYADEEEEEDDDDVSDDNDDCDGEDEYSSTLIGEAELAAGLPQCVKDMVEKDKMRAGTSATKEGAGSVVFEEASQVLNAEDSAASEKMIKGLAVEDLKIV